MKKFFLMILIFLSTNLLAQRAPHPQGSNIQNTELDKFVGIWLWSSGTESIKLILQKQTVHFPMPFNYDEERIVGWHLYMRNGNVEQSSLSNVGIQFTWDHPEMATLLGTTQVRNNNEVYFTKFWDLQKNKKCELRFRMLPGSTTQATWKLSNPRGLKYGSTDFSFSFPSDLVFTKQ